MKNLVVSALLFWSSTFLTSAALADGEQCRFLFDSGQMSAAIYTEAKSKNHGKNLMELLSDGPIRIEEVIAHLDSQIITKESLFDRIHRFRLSVNHASAFRRLFFSTVSSRKGKINIRQQELQTQKEVEDFISDLLKALYKAEIHALRDNLFHIFPRATGKINEIIKIDSFFYENHSVFQDFLVLKARDSLGKNPYFESALNFFLFFGDPIVNHRLSLNDLQLYQSGKLANDLKRRLQVPIVTNAIRRKIIWSAVFSSIVVLPFNIADAVQNMGVMVKTADYISENILEVRQQNEVRFAQNIIKVIQKRIDSLQVELEAAKQVELEAAKQVKNPDKVSALELELDALRTELSRYQ